MNGETGPVLAENDESRGRTRKSADAYRTISEIADELHVPQHVLRFWETKFPRIKPLKRGGGRRYYRPDDVVLLRRIANLLYIQGYTIKGVQRLLKEGGGALHDEIPPASEEERAAAAAERAQTSVLAASTPPRADVPELPIHHTPPAQATTPARPQALTTDLESMLARSHHINTILRTTLQTTLAELEHLRARLTG
ncbi:MULTISPECIES: MerR family transcriptional regulator [unclassified Acidiphilium]|uniref:MerR family transcriptional regulator n=1 Tax=unclassified Acidiphilium TaxID=2617493 RepID=UPI00257E8952|nr:MULTISPECIES: MerR family transcriptional regulator [unclassified Acidiphilium]